MTRMEPLSVHSAKAEQIVRDVLIEATDIIRLGDEPFVGWSAVLAERIVLALEDRGRVAVWVGRRS